MIQINSIKPYLPKVLLFSGIIIIGVSIVLYLKSSKKEIRVKTQKQASWLVETIPVQFGIYSPYQQLYGKVNAEKIIKVFAHSGGEIKTVYVSSGELVNAGDKLVLLDADDLATTKDINQAQVAQTKLEIKQTKINIDASEKLLAFEKSLLALDKKRFMRATKLAEQQNISDAELEKSQETYIRRQATITNQEKNQQDATILLERLKSRLESEQSKLTQASRNFTLATKKSVVNGLVTHVHVQAGSRVGVNTAMLEILPLENIEITATLVNNQLPTILTSLKEQSPINASVSAFGLSLEATLTRLKGESERGSAVGIFELKSPELSALTHLRPNALLPVMLQLPEVANSVIVPYSALYGSNKIYVVREGHLHSVNVELFGSLPVEGSSEDWALIKSDEIQKSDFISITHLPNATHNLAVTAKTLNQ